MHCRERLNKGNDRSDKILDQEHNEIGGVGAFVYQPCQLSGNRTLSEWLRGTGWYLGPRQLG